MLGQQGLGRDDRRPLGPPFPPSAIGSNGQVAALVVWEAQTTFSALLPEHSVLLAQVLPHWQVVLDLSELVHEGKKAAT
jgi:hypothetical protein